VHTKLAAADSDREYRHCFQKLDLCCMYCAWNK